MMGWDLRLPGILQHYDVMRMDRASGSVGVGPGSHPGPLCLIWEETASEPPTALCLASALGEDCWESDFPSLGR